MKKYHKEGKPIFPDDQKAMMMVHHCTVTHGFSTTITMRCSNGHFKHFCEGPKNFDRVYTDAEKKSLKIKTMTHDINVLMALSIIVNGIGYTEMSRLASFIGLGNATSIETNCHKIAKHYLNEIIIDISEEIIKDALVNEARQSARNQLSESLFDLLWPDIEKGIRGDFSQISEESKAAINSNKIRLCGAVDMGWQKRSSGRKYDSPSGHMFLVGSETGKVISYTYMSLNCRQCLINRKNKEKNKPEKEHTCFKNFEGHSKAMEATSARKLIIDLKQQNDGMLYMHNLCADDDSTMKKYCSHKGGLPTDIPEPIFLADPSHRVKLIARKVFYILAYLSKKKSEMTCAMANRLKINLSHFTRKCRKRKNITAEWMSRHAMCVIDHMFDDHKLCTTDFCYKKKFQEDFILKEIENLRESDELPVYMEGMKNDPDDLLDFMERNPHNKDDPPKNNGKLASIPSVLAIVIPQLT